MINRPCECFAISLGTAEEVGSGVFVKKVTTPKRTQTGITQAGIELDTKSCCCKAAAPCP